MTLTKQIRNALFPLLFRKIATGTKKDMRQIVGKGLIPALLTETEINENKYLLSLFNEII